MSTCCYWNHLDDTPCWQCPVNLLPKLQPLPRRSNLPTTIKVQIQLQGAEQTPTSKIATLHHQIVYRLQNHALDLPTPYITSDALMILADTDTIPTIIQIPKQIQKQELLKLMPLEWLTNYEHFHQNSDPVQTTEAKFEQRNNGQVKLSFQPPDTKPVSDAPQLSYTAMITAVQTGQETNLPIHGFSSKGYPVYPDKINGHFIWDVPEAHMCNPDCPCLDDTDVDEELEIMRRKKKKKHKPCYPKSSCKSFPPQPPPDPKPPVQQIWSCLMVSSQCQSYSESFPPLEKHIDPQTRVTSKPYVQSPVTASGQPKELKQYEAVLNWQTKNASAQYQTLHQLGRKIDRVASQVSQTETKVDTISNRLDQIYQKLQDRISELDTDLRLMINNHIWGPEFNKKEAEIRRLKVEIARIDAEKVRPSLFTQPPSSPSPPSMFDTFTPSMLLPDLNLNLFTIRFLVFPIFNHELHHSHLPLKSQGLKLRFLIQKSIHLHQFLQNHLKIPQNPLQNHQRKTKAQWINIIIILSNNHLLIPLNLNQIMSHIHLIPTSLPPPHLQGALPLILNLNMLISQAY